MTAEHGLNSKQNLVAVYVSDLHQFSLHAGHVFSNLGRQKKQNKQKQNKVRHCS